MSIPNVNAVDIRGDTLLHRAVYSYTIASTATEKALLLADIKALTSQSDLNLSAINNNKEHVSRKLAEMLKNVSETEMKDVVDGTLVSHPDAMVKLFHSAIYAHNLEMVKYLLSKDPELINKKSEYGFSPFQTALAASALNVEQFFHENYSDQIREDAKLKLGTTIPVSGAAIIKAAFTYENNDPALKAKYEAIIDELYQNPEFRATLDLVAASLLGQRTADNKPMRFFVSAGDNIRSLTPKSNAYGDLDFSASMLRSGGARNKEETKGTLIHEFTHLAALITYNNNAIPYRPGTPQEAEYNKAIEKLKQTGTDRAMLTKTDEALLKLLITRMGGYINKDGGTGALSAPEWIVSIPQGMVLYGNQYDSAQVSTLQNFAGPMYYFWKNTFNADVEKAFVNHPNNHFVDKDYPYTNEVRDKNILTTSVTGLKDIIFEKYKYNLTGSRQSEGYSEGVAKQNNVVQQIMFGNVFDSYITRNPFPENISTANGHALVNNPIFKSQEYRDAHKAIYNEVTKICEERNLREISMNNLDAATKERLANLIPNDLKKSIGNTVSRWGSDISNHYQSIHNQIERALEKFTADMSMSKESLAILTQKLTEQLVKQVPINSEFVQDKLEKALADKLPDSKLLTEASSGFFSSKKVKVNTDDDKSITNLAKSIMQDPQITRRVKKDVSTATIAFQLSQTEEQAKQGLQRAATPRARENLHAYFHTNAGCRTS